MERGPRTVNPGLLRVVPASAEEPAMDLRVQYIAECPHWELAAQRLRAALDRAGCARVEVVHEYVSSDEHAALLDFRGSPTILIGGHDPFIDPHGTVGMSCRTYRTEHGVEGAPSVEQLLAALARAQHMNDDYRHGAHRRPRARSRW
jgi:hypothetical protein